MKEICILGDCFKTLDKMIKNKEFVDFALTSPPYNRKRNDKYMYYDDLISDYFKFNKAVIDKLLKVTKKHVFYNIQANYYNRSDVYKIIGHYSDKIKDIHIWEKRNPMPASGKNVTNAVEYFLVLGDSSLKSNTTYTKNIISTSVNSNMPKEHKAVMKLEVAEHFISKFTQEGNVVLDPFMGIATTGLACKKMNRGFVGVELKEQYYKMAIERLRL